MGGKIKSAVSPPTKAGTPHSYTQLKELYLHYSMDGLFGKTEKEIAMTVFEKIEAQLNWNKGGAA